MHAILSRLRLHKRDGTERLLVDDDQYEIPTRLPDLITPFCNKTTIKSVCFWFEEGLFYVGGNYARKEGQGDIKIKGELVYRSFKSPEEILEILKDVDSLAGRVVRDYISRKLEEELLT